MFVIREFLVSLGFFAASYCILSLLVAGGWQVWSRLQGRKMLGSARLLFALRVFPLAASAFVTLFLAFPAFLLLESNAIDEDLGTLLFSVCGLLIIGAAIARVISARATASRVVSGWVRGASTLDAGAEVPALQIRNGLPSVMLVGVSQPQVLVSEHALSFLSGGELRVAVRHEIGHLRSRDNLKKLIFHAAVFPGMASLEAAWREAAEFAADKHAVSSPQEAVDLAAALVKMSEMAPVEDVPAFTTGLVNVPGLLAVRVQRLLTWNENDFHTFQSRLRYLLLLAFFPLLYVAVDYNRLLLLTHRMTEWFIH